MVEKKFKVLNLFAGIGGNRKLWPVDCEVTAVEFDSVIAGIYQDFFPQDRVVVGDAYEFLLEHFREFDFVWASPPCQSHSSFRHNICVRFRGTVPKYPDLRLYELILFLKHNFLGKWVVENVRPFYVPLIAPSVVLQRHLFWSNFDIPVLELEKSNIRKDQIPQLQDKFGFDLSGVCLRNKRQVLRNCVSPVIGAWVFEHARK